MLKIHIFNLGPTQSKSFNNSRNIRCSFIFYFCNSFTNSLFSHFFVCIYLFFRIILVCMFGVDCICKCFFIWIWFLVDFSRIYFPMWISFGVKMTWSCVVWFSVCKLNSMYLFTIYGYWFLYQIVIHNYNELFLLYFLSIVIFLNYGVWGVICFV